MMRATEIAHLLMNRTVMSGDLVVDATVGNGHDTRHLANLVGPTGRVIGFDVQDIALQSARQRVGDLPQVILLATGHENLAVCLAELVTRKHGTNIQSDGAPQLAAVMFNLGYLPGGPKTVTTRPETTVSALRQALDLLKPGGLVTLVLYPGHCGGREETTAVLAFAEDLDPAFSVARYHRVNCHRPAPELVAIERNRGPGREEANDTPLAPAPSGRAFRI